HAGLWTDSRYFLQAESQLAGTGIQLQKQKVPHAPEHIDWLAENLLAGARVGIDGRLFSIGQVRHLQRALERKGIQLQIDL
ncbi:MAG: aminopeptidase P family N-terminal domain-containing protein, partial [Saprospiraceae bacterium]|nr:aminopeptidase P family N-terminal domain-containing protein [Saprospiraceae bacterium]